MITTKWVCRTCGLVFVAEDGSKTHMLMSNHVVDRLEEAFIKRKEQIQKLLDELFMKDDHNLFWHTKHPLLGDTPFDLMKTEEGFKKVEAMLEAMEDGSFL